MVTPVLMMTMGTEAVVSLGCQRPRNDRQVENSKDAVVPRETIMLSWFQAKGRKVSHAPYRRKLFDILMCSPFEHWVGWWRRLGMVRHDDRLCWPVASRASRLAFFPAVFVCSAIRIK